MVSINKTLKIIQLVFIFEIDFWWTYDQGIDDYI